MTELYNRIIEQRGSLERLVARIPGFRGYQEKQARRKADRMLRDFISDEIQKRIDRFTRLEVKILDKIGLSLMDRTRDIKTVMQTYRDRVATAAPKYDGMFASMKIETEDLERIYAFDEAQIRYVDRFDDVLSTLEAAVTSGEKASIETALDTVHEVAAEANEAFMLRDDVLTNLNKSL